MQRQNRRIAMKKYRPTASSKPVFSKSGIGNWTVYRKGTETDKALKVNVGKRVKTETVLTSKLYRQSLK